MGKSFLKTMKFVSDVLFAKGVRDESSEPDKQIKQKAKGRDSDIRNGKRRGSRSLGRSCQRPGRSGGWVGYGCNADDAN